MARIVNTTFPGLTSTAPITPLATLPSRGSGASYALACQSEWQDWYTQDNNFYQNLSYFVTTITATPEFVFAEPTVKPYTICDGIPRYDQSRVIVTRNVSTFQVRTD